ncbi:zona pellucida-like domain protein [Dictyocaulus viviparus]|uniref:Zona pellucida-like domain protein n=1 Tax=Dictyocaulus viviparus TaxID=29172 RepID=A0A0D8YFR7_DICVI|nr:zona pellucida-like domain protein [Dictyocaulus viviparus]
MRRQRTNFFDQLSIFQLQPRGVFFSFTLVVSFHPHFVVGIDRAFHIRCFFLESVKSLNIGFDVGNLRTELIEQELKLPECYYQLRDGVNGPSVQYAQVGQQVTHQWICDNESSWVYGMLIHSCFVDDGQGNIFELIDNRGCSKDSYLLPEIKYDSDSLSAFTEANVFKYADKAQIYFTCTVQLCYKHDGGCDGITPPICERDPNLTNTPTFRQFFDQSHQQIETSHDVLSSSREYESSEVDDDSLSRAPFSGPALPKKQFFESIGTKRGFTRHRDSPLNETDGDDVSSISRNATAPGELAKLLTFHNSYQDVIKMPSSSEHLPVILSTDIERAVLLNVFIQEHLFPL